MGHEILCGESLTRETCRRHARARVCFDASGVRIPPCLASHLAVPAIVPLRTVVAQRHGMTLPRRGPLVTSCCARCLVATALWEGSIGTCMYALLYQYMLQCMHTYMHQLAALYMHGTRHVPLHKSEAVHSCTLSHRDSSMELKSCTSEKDAELAQKWPFVVVFLQERTGQLASFGRT